MFNGSKILWGLDRQLCIWDESRMDCPGVSQLLLFLLT